MRSRERFDVRSESGLIGAGSLIAIGIALLLGYLLLAAFNGDTERFGSVPVPGKAAFELPEGDVDIYYAEGIDPDSGVALTVPEDLDYTIFDPEGVSVPVESRGDEAKSTDDGLARLIGAVQVPSEATYTVETSSQEVQQRISPVITLGQGPFAAVKDRFDEVIEALRGPVGIAVVGVILVLFLLPRYRRAKQRSEYNKRA